MSLGIDKNNLELDNGDIITGLPNLGTWDPYLLKKEKTLKKIHCRVTQARKIIGALNGVRWSKEVKKTEKDEL